MKERIIECLNQIESDRNIKILLACETGSRAWGFPSPDSDYDIRMVYVHEPEWYLSLNERKDTIEMMLDDNNLDISGWDLRKSLRLLWKSNPPFLERIQSPILYKYDKQFSKEVNSLADEFYSPIATLHHYLNIAKKSYEAVAENDTYKLKTFFYGLRTALACQWILEKSEIPPIEFQKILDGIQLESNLKKKIEDLIQLKSTRNESYFHSGEKDILTLMKETIDRADQKRKDLSASQGDMKDLDHFFRKWLKK
ncbi:nucleotidyltransferase domain-containing protein [Halocola ammonii]